MIIQIYLIEYIFKTCFFLGKCIRFTSTIYRCSIKMFLLLLWRHWGYTCITQTKLENQIHHCAVQSCKFHSIWCKNCFGIILDYVRVWCYHIQSILMEQQKHRVKLLLTIILARLAKQLYINKVILLDKINEFLLPQAHLI